MKKMFMKFKEKPTTGTLFKGFPCPPKGGATDLRKPYGQLVPLGYVHCCTSTYGLSTWSSPTAL